MQKRQVAVEDNTEVLVLFNNWDGLFEVREAAWIDGIVGSAFFVCFHHHDCAFYFLSISDADLHSPFGSPLGTNVDSILQLSGVAADQNDVVCISEYIYFFVVVFELLQQVLRTQPCAVPTLMSKSSDF